MSHTTIGRFRRSLYVGRMTEYLSCTGSILLKLGRSQPVYVAFKPIQAFRRSQMDGQSAFHALTAGVRFNKKKLAKQIEPFNVREADHDNLL